MAKARSRRASEETVGLLPPQGEHFTVLDDQKPRLSGLPARLILPGDEALQREVNDIPTNARYMGADLAIQVRWELPDPDLGRHYSPNVEIRTQNNRIVTWEIVQAIEQQLPERIVRLYIYKGR